MTTDIAVKPKGAQEKPEIEWLSGQLRMNGRVRQKGSKMNLIGLPKSKAWAFWDSELGAMVNWVGYLLEDCGVLIVVDTEERLVGITRI